MPCLALITPASNGVFGRPSGNLGSAGNLLERLDTVKVVRCDEVQWRFLGLSLAGYNVLISLLMAAIAAWGIVGKRA
jgi:disulfide bond formation protein DsbB